MDLSSIFWQEELYRKQRSKISCLREGDSNTKFFYLIANDRHNKNFIRVFVIAWIGLKETLNLGKAFLEHLHLLFGTLRPFRFLLDWQNLFSHKERLDLLDLECAFLIEEIKQAIFDLGADKGPWHDGFPMVFFQNIAPWFKMFASNSIMTFFEGRAHQEWLNWVNITLIPKTNSLECINNYRCINLINSSCKIISKLLANRLSQVINSLVDDS